MRQEGPAPLIPERTSAADRQRRRSAEAERAAQPRLLGGDIVREVRIVTPLRPNARPGIRLTGPRCPSAESTGILVRGSVPELRPSSRGEAVPASSPPAVGGASCSVRGGRVRGETDGPRDSSVRFAGERRHREKRAVQQGAASGNTFFKIKTDHFCIALKGLFNTI